MNDFFFLIKTSIPVTLLRKIPTFRDSNRSFKLGRDYLETMTKYDFNVSHSNPQEHKLVFEFGEE